MDKFKLIVAGGRDFNLYKVLSDNLDRLLVNKREGLIEIVCGGAKGADSLGEKYAQDNGLYIRYFRAEWDEYGKRSGILRNIEMGDYADALVAFWDGKSKGTKHMIDYAKSKGLAVRVIYYGLYKGGGV